MDWSIPTEKVSDYFLLLPCFIEIHVFNDNSIDPDQISRSAVSDLCLFANVSFFYWTLGLNGLINTFPECLFYWTLGLNGLINTFPENANKCP